MTDRITPAYAGKSRKRIYGKSKSQDHPCVCGEKEKSAKNDMKSIGSPLRMRGKGQVLQRPLLEKGITPAYAGKRRRSSRFRRATRDHPCVCGEKNQSWQNSSRKSGSPLRMRGKDSSSVGSTFRIRITPAYAGKSCSRSTHSPPI